MIVTSRYFYSFIAPELGRMALSVGGDPDSAILSRAVTVIHWAGVYHVAIPFASVR